MAAGTVLHLRVGLKRHVAQTLADRLDRGGFNEVAAELENALAAVQHRGGALVASVEAVADGDTIGEDVSVTSTHTQATTDEDDTVVIGATTLTWKASPSGEDQVDIGTDDGECGDNLAAAINAHSELQGLVEASSDGAGVVTITMRNPGRLGQHILLAETGDAVVLSATSFATSGTITAVSTAAKAVTK